MNWARLAPSLYGYKTFVAKTGQTLRYTERKPFNFCTIIYYRTTALDTLLSTLLTLIIITSYMYNTCLCMFILKYLYQFYREIQN